MTPPTRSLLTFNCLLPGTGMGISSPARPHPVASCPVPPCQQTRYLRPFPHPKWRFQRLGPSPQLCAPPPRSPPRGCRDGRARAACEREGVQEMGRREEGAPRCQQVRLPGSRLGISLAGVHFHEGEGEGNGGCRGPALGGSFSAGCAGAGGSRRDGSRTAAHLPAPDAQVAHYLRAILSPPRAA